MKSFIGILGSVLLPFLLCIPLLASAEQYLCVAEKTSGFAYNKAFNKWDNAFFKTDSKYLVSKSDDERYALKVTQIGQDFPISRCKVDFNGGDFLFCDGFKEFNFNRKNLRFIATYTYGYVNVVPDTNHITDEKSDTPAIEIGVCTRIQLSPSN